MNLFDFFFGGLWVFAQLGEDLLRAGRSARQRKPRRVPEARQETGGRHG